MEVKTVFNHYISAVVAVSLAVPLGGWLYRKWKGRSVSADQDLFADPTKALTALAQAKLGEMTKLFAHPSDPDFLISKGDDLTKYYEEVSTIQNIASLAIGGAFVLGSSTYLIGSCIHRTGEVQQCLNEYSTLLLRGKLAAVLAAGAILVSKAAYGLIIQPVAVIFCHAHPHWKYYFKQRVAKVTEGFYKAANTLENIHSENKNDPSKQKSVFITALQILNNIPLIKNELSKHLLIKDKNEVNQITIPLEIACSRVISSHNPTQ